MKAILPDGANGIFFGDVPDPELFDNAVLCKTTHSLISTGTERMIIGNTTGKSREEILKGSVMLGYCGAGLVDEVRGSDLPFRHGQRVAYYGAPYVSHRARVVVPRHLVLPVPDGVAMEEAVFVGIGAIALHGFRKSGAGLGDTCLVVGLGVIGNLCAQIAALAGCRTIATDSNAARVETLSKCIGRHPDCAAISPEEVEETVRRISGGHGADTVLLCVSTSSAKPMEQAVAVVRPGGRIVVVGVLDIHVPRPVFFDREAEITISRAAGPGRYDANYERSGIDYPVQYARWTEGRNLEAVLHWISDGRLRVKPLISRTFPVDQARDAYERIMSGRNELGYILEWK